MLASTLCASDAELRHMSADKPFDMYDATLWQLADTHAPAFTAVRRIRCLSMWFDSDCCHARRKTRLLERRHRWSKSDQDRMAWVAQVRSMHALYHQGQSTETAILKVISDIIDAADSQKITLLGLLDMSATFDTVDHKILLRHLEESFGVRG